MKNSNRLLEFKELPQTPQKSLSKRMKDELRRTFIRDLKADLRSNGMPDDEITTMVETFQFGRI